MGESRAGLGPLMDYNNSKANLIEGVIIERIDVKSSSRAT